MSKSAAFVFAAALVSLAYAPQASAQSCAIDDCPNGVNCYKLNPWKWCQKTYTANGHYTKVNVYNHTKYSQINTAWDQWNAPPSGPANTVWLVSDGINNADHDIDYWEVYVAGEYWWGWTHTPSSGGCINLKGGWIDMNNANIPGANCSRMKVSLHETGHGIGFGHVCNCPQMMTPCLNCATCSLSLCDGKAAQAHYP
jgi:hypothetical protein